MENNLIVTPEQAVRRIMSSVPKYVQKNNSVHNLNDNDNEDFPFMTPELKAKMEAQTKIIFHKPLKNQKKLRNHQ